MSENPHGHEPEDEQEEGVRAPSSLRDNLRKRREELAAEAAAGGRTTKLPIPAYNDELWAEFTYKPDTWDGLKKIGKRAEKSRHPRMELHVAMDTLALACTGIFISEDNGMTFEPYDEEGECSGFDERLAELMEIKLESKSKVRELISKIFNNDLAITGMSNRVSEWMQGENEEVNDDF